MSQVILVGSYCGLSTYTFEVQVTGRALSMSEVKQLGLVDDNALRRHKASSYSQEWYEIKHGDRVRVRVSEDDDEKVEEMEFEIPETPLPVLPQRLDDTFTIDLLTCLKEHCRRIK